MKKFLLVLCLLFFTAKIFGQQFSQYNTGTLYDSFENPSQRAFIPDTSKKFASNFLIPNFNFNFFLSGDAQATLKTRAFINRYNDSLLKIGKGRNNLTNMNANIYVLMLKMFASLNGDEEMGLSWQIKAEGQGVFTDESIAALNGTGSFTDGTIYNNLFNSNYYYQMYHQISFTYREKFDKRFAFGIKFSGLLGIQYQNLTITNSQATFNNTLHTADVALAGRYYNSFVPGPFTRHDFLPTFRNPGAAITIGTSYRTEDSFIIQGNIKDLGFIHWSSRSHVYDFAGSAVVQGLATSGREDSLYNKVYKIVRSNSATVGSFTTPIDGRAELSVTKSFWVNDDHTFKYSPTAIASKQLFYSGFIGALVNPFQYKKYVFTLTTTYDDLKTFNLGAQFMIKTPNLEFYVGSDKLTQTASLVSEAANKNSTSISQNSANTGADFFLGFSVKFGPVVEHPMNASTIPTGESGFLSRLWGRLFKSNNN
jgi:hypothetical protein